MKTVTSALAAAFVALATPALAATTWNAFDAFQDVGGVIQTGPFAGGTSTGPFTGAVTPFTTAQAPCGTPDFFCLRTGDASIAKAYAGDFDPPNSVFFKTGFLNMHPDPVTDSVLQFVAPTAGDYRFAGSFAIHDVSPTGVTVSGYVGAVQQFGGLLLNGASPFDFQASLAAGDRVSFVLGAAGDYTFDSTGLGLTVTKLERGAVPEPAAWALMILGFGAAGAMLRRQSAAQAA
jgi:hypothetical protein